MSYTTHDSGKREEQETGFVRDTQDGKPRYDLIPLKPLERLAALYARGAQKYGDNNWRKGSKWSRCVASLLRHVFAYLAVLSGHGDASEDHAAAIVFNVFALMEYETTHPELNDLCK